MNNNVIMNEETTEVVAVEAAEVAATEIKKFDLNKWLKIGTIGAVAIGVCVFVGKKIVDKKKAKKIADETNEEVEVREEAVEADEVVEA